MSDLNIYQDYYLHFLLILILNSFLITDTAVGARGFEAVWSEIKDDGTSCDALQCPKSGYCVSNDMKCNGAPNCGFYDQIDEDNCKSN